MKTASEGKLVERLNELAEVERKHEETRREVFAQWREARASQIRAGREPVGPLPVLRDREFEFVLRKEQLLRDRVADQPLLDRAIANINAENAAA